MCEKILLVDRCPAARAAIAEGLRDAGYEVVEAAYAEEALRIWGRQRGEIDVAVAAYTLAGRSGVALIAELQRQDPNLVGLVLSEYPRHVLAQRGVLPTPIAVLQKPCEPAFLCQVLPELVALHRGTWHLQ